MKFYLFLYVVFAVSMACILRLTFSILAFSVPCLSQYPLSSSQTAINGSGYSGHITTLGNVYNYWNVTEDGVYDLTRSSVAPVTNPVEIPMSGRRKTALVEPSRSALVIIDMQNYFLHPALSPKATGGRAAVTPTANMIQGFRSKGMKVLWTNWGLDDFDLLTIPPAFKAGFAKNGSNFADETFGSDMGTVSVSVTDESQPCNGNGDACRDQEAGRLLTRGAWNAQPWGVLNDLKNEGLASGTDLYFHKNRLSGLWGAQTPLGLWLQENGITTLFFGGVNADQCVWSNLIDAYFKGRSRTESHGLSADNGLRIRCCVRGRHIGDNKSFLRDSDGAVQR